MLKSTLRYISFFSESALRSSPVKKHLYVRLKHYKVNNVIGEETKLEPQWERMNFPDTSPHCAFVARAQARFGKNAKKKINMKRSLDNTTSIEDSTPSRVRLDTMQKFNSDSSSSYNVELLHQLGQSSSNNDCNPECSMSFKCTHNGTSEPHSIPEDFRKWEIVNRRALICSKNNGLPITIMSYNVLAQCLLESHSYLYRMCPSNVLKWDFRAHLLFAEICKLDPDIICLQEVQESHLESFYCKFEDRGYTGVYKKRTGIREDGCAIYFKSSKFAMLGQSNVEFYQPQLSLLNRDNIGLMVKLVPHSMQDTPFIIATTHLLYNPKRTDVRLAQMQVFLAEIDRFSYCNVLSDENRTMHLPTIMTGDLNSLPNSPVHNLVVKGIVGGMNRDPKEWKEIAVTDQCQHLGVVLDRISGQKSTDVNLSKLHHSEDQHDEGSLKVPQEESQTLSPRESFVKSNTFFNSGSIEHTLAFETVYMHDKENRETEATTFQDRWITVDYIFYSTKSSSGKLTLLERWRLPTANECKILKYIPNQIIGSDHLALAATFLLTPPSK